MFSEIRYSFALLRAGRTLAAYDALLTPEQVAQLPWAARVSLSIAKFGTRKPEKDGERAVAAALSSLGPSYIKLGQFLATRPDLVGPHRAFELKALQDRLPPFPTETAKDIVRDTLGAPVNVLFTEFGPPVAAASVAQVHKARSPDGHELAVLVSANASQPISAASTSPHTCWSASAPKAPGCGRLPPSTCLSNP